MPKMKKPALDETVELVRAMLSVEGPQSLDGTIASLQQVRSLSAETAAVVDRTLVETVAEYRRALKRAQRDIHQCRELLEQLSAPPLHPAVFHRVINATGALKALVQAGNARRVVSPGEEINLTRFVRGDEVFLNNEQNLIIAASPDGPPSCGETAAFERCLPDGRLVLRHHDDHIVVDVCGKLANTKFKAGDAVRFDRTIWMAYEKIELETSRRYLLEEVPNLPLDSVGGQGANLESLLSVLTMILVNPKLAATYGLNGRSSILMAGPPGCGKTLMARVAASEVSRLTGKKCRLAVVKPSEWESPWVGQTQENIRQCFQALREVGEDGYAVLFMDEIESVGRIRGGAVSHHSDKFLAALLAELDGFTDRKNVAIICATNRKDLLDAALYERLSDLEINVGRPEMKGARAIFQIHLPESVPFHPNGELAMPTREALIDHAVSQFYSPNAGNELCTLRFRDGKQRIIVARELASGRLFENVCRSARRSAFLREVRGGVAGVQLMDMQEAVSQTLERMRTTLTIRNAQAYLPDLPQDVDVVSVEPIVRRVKQPHKYLNQPA
jgi:ATP-dependent 26S proteasome regulatory subunit